MSGTPGWDLTLQRRAVAPAPGTLLRNRFFGEQDALVN